MDECLRDSLAEEVVVAERDVWVITCEIHPLKPHMCVPECRKRHADGDFGALPTGDAQVLHLWLCAGVGSTAVI